MGLNVSRYVDLPKKTQTTVANQSNHDVDYYKLANMIQCAKYQFKFTAYHSHIYKGVITQIFLILWWVDMTTTESGPRLNIKTVFIRDGYFHVKSKTVARPSYLWHRDSYTGKSTYLYWDEPLPGVSVIR